MDDKDKLQNIQENTEDLLDFVAEGADLPTIEDAPAEASQPAPEETLDQKISTILKYLKDLYKPNNELYADDTKAFLKNQYGKIYEDVSGIYKNLSKALNSISLLKRGIISSESAKIVIEKSIRAFDLLDEKYKKSPELDQYIQQITDSLPDITNAYNQDTLNDAIKAFKSYKAGDSTLEVASEALSKATDLIDQLDDSSRSSEDLKPLIDSVTQASTQINRESDKKFIDNFIGIIQGKEDSKNIKTKVDEFSERLPSLKKKYESDEEISQALKTAEVGLSKLKSVLESIQDLHIKINTSRVKSDLSDKKQPLMDPNDPKWGVLAETKDFKEANNEIEKSNAELDQIISIFQGKSTAYLSKSQVSKLSEVQSGKEIIESFKDIDQSISQFKDATLLYNTLFMELPAAAQGYLRAEDTKLLSLITSDPISTLEKLAESFKSNTSLKDSANALKGLYKKLRDPKTYLSSLESGEIEDLKEFLPARIKALISTITEALKDLGYSQDAVINKLIPYIIPERVESSDGSNVDIKKIIKDAKILEATVGKQYSSGQSAFLIAKSFIRHQKNYNPGELDKIIASAFIPTVFNPSPDIPQELIDSLNELGIKLENTPESQKRSLETYMDFYTSNDAYKGEIESALRALRSRPLNPTQNHPGFNSAEEVFTTQRKLVTTLASRFDSQEYQELLRQYEAFDQALKVYLKNPDDRESILFDLEQHKFRLNPDSLRKYLLENNKLKEDQITPQERLDLQNGIQSNINNALEELSVAGKRVDTFRAQAEKTGEELPKEVSDAIAEFETIKKRFKDNPPESLADAVNIKLRAQSVAQTLRNLYYSQFGDSSPASDIDKSLMETELESLRIDRNQYVKDAEKYGGDTQKIKEISDKFDQALRKALEGIKNTSITISELNELYKTVETFRNVLKNTAKNLKQTYTGPIETLSDTQVKIQRANLTAKDLSAQKIFNEASSYGADPQKLDQLIREYQTVSDEIKQLLSQDVVPKAELEDDLTKLATAYQNLSNYSTELKLSFVKAEDPVEKIQQRLKMIDNIIQGINSAINTLLSALKAGLNVVHKTITTLGRAIAAIPRTLTRIVQLFGNLGNRVRGVNALTNAWVVLDSKLNLVERAYNAIFSNQYLTSVQQTLGGISGLNQISEETANTIIEFAEAMEYAFGTPMSTMISQTSELALLMRSLGVQTENIANASLMISTVGLSLQASGILGGDYDAIMTKIVSGLRGETEAIADVGIDVRAKTLDDFVAKIKQAPEAFGLTADAVSNLANSTSQLTEKQLVNLRILAIYNQYVQNNGELLRNYAGYMDTVVGRVNGLKSAFTTLFSTVGVVIYQIVAAIGPYLEYIIRLITSAVSALAKLLGFETSWSELSGQMSGSFDSQTGSIQDNTEATEENTAAKNSNKGALASFDRITSIDSTSGSDSSKDSEADLSGLLSGLPNMNDLLDQYLNGDSRMDTLEEKWKSMMDSMKEKFQQFANDITGHEVDITFGFDSKQFNDGLALAWESIKRIFNTIGETVAYYAIRIAEDLQIGKLISGAAEGLDNITKALADVLEIMQPVAKLFYETFLSPIFKSAGESLYEWLTAGSEEFSNQWVASAESLAQRLTEAMQSENPWENFIGVISEEFPLLGNLITLIESVSKAIGSVWETVSPLIGEFGQFAQDTIIPYLADTFERMATYIDQNRESIQELLTALGEFAWDIVTTAIEGIGKVIDTIVTNKDLVMELLDGFSTAFKFVVDHPEIITLLIGGKVATTVAGGALGAAETGLDIFSSLKGLGIIGGSGAGAAGTGIGAAVRSGLKTVSSKASTILGKIPGVSVIGSKVSGIGASVGSTVSGAVSTVMNIPAFQTVSAFFSQIGTAIAPIAAAAAPVLAVVAAIGSMIYALSNNEELMNRFKDSLGRLWESLGKLWESLGRVWDLLSPIVELVGTLLVDALMGLTDILGGVITAVSGLVDFIIGVITLDGDLIEQGVQEMFDGVVQILSGLWDAITNIFTDIKDSVMSILTGKGKSDTTLGESGAKELFNSAAKGQRWTAERKDELWNQFTSQYSGNIKNATDTEVLNFLNQYLEMPHAEGGIFSQPHYALFAEDGAEAVIPLSSKYRSKALPIFMQTAGILGFNLSDAITSQTSITSIPSIGSVQLPQINTGLDKQDSSGSDSIRDGVEEALFGVINQLISQGYLTKGGANNYSANTDSVLRLLARLLAPYLTAQTSNISNSGFTIR